MAYAERTKRFLARYYHDGSWWSVEIYASDWADAEAICRAHNLRLDGEHIITIPAMGGSWLPRVVCWLRNALRGKYAIGRGR